MDIILIFIFWKGRPSCYDNVRRDRGGVNYLFNEVPLLSIHQQLYCRGQGVDMCGSGRLIG